MVRMYGVAHGGELKDIFGRSHGEFCIEPSVAFLRDLINLPNNSRVGIEALPKEKWNVIVRDLAERASSLPWECHPQYNNASTKYWESIEDALGSFGHQAVFLEDTPIWLKYNERVIAKIKQEIKGRRLRVTKEGETNRAYTEKLMRLNEADHQAEIQMRKIHEIDRDNEIVKAIKRGRVDAVIVGLGHAHYWTLHQKTIPFTIDSFCVDNPPRNHREIQGVFIPNAQPDRQIAFERTGLERAANLIDTGSFSQKTPDYVGTWEFLPYPTAGYFEMFIQERAGNQVKGTIKDTLGDATFEGEITDKKLRFVKQYTQNRRPDALATPIVYEAEARDNQYAGYFSDGQCKRPFALIPAPKADPIALAMIWCDRFESDK